MMYQDPAEAKAAGVTYHLAPKVVWEAQKASGAYRPESYEQDGFIHTANGLDDLLCVANDYYTADTREQTVLVIDTSRLTSTVRYDDPREIFPHIYGFINAEAVIGELAVQRDAEQRYVAFEEADVQGM